MSINLGQENNVITIKNNINIRIDTSEHRRSTIVKDHYKDQQIDEQSIKSKKTSRRESTKLQILEQ